MSWPPSRISQQLVRILALRFHQVCKSVLAYSLSVFHYLYFQEISFQIGARGRWLTDQVLNFLKSLSLELHCLPACRVEQQGLSFGSLGPCRRRAWEGALGRPWRGGGDWPSVHSLWQPQHLEGKALFCSPSACSLLRGKGSKKGRFGSKKSLGSLNNNELFWNRLILSSFYLPSSFSDYAAPDLHFQHFF